MADTGKKVAIVAVVLGILLFSGVAGASPPGTDPGGPDPDPDDDDDDNGGGGVVFVPPTSLPPLGPVAPVGPTFPGTGEIDWDELVKTYPTGGTFYQVVPGDMFGGTSSTRSIAYRLLLTEAFRAAQNVGEVDDNAARAFAREIADSGSRRREMIADIQCAWFNDMVYGTHGYGTQAQPGPHGRAIRLLPYHPNNLQRLQNGEGVARNIMKLAPIDAGKSGSWNGGRGGPADPELRETYELLWLPKLNEEQLWVNRVITTEGMTWTDGSSMGHVPPPGVMNRNHESYDPTTSADFTDWGCE